MRWFVLLLGMLAWACSPECRNYVGDSGACARRDRPTFTEPAWSGTYFGETEGIMVSLSLYSSPACYLVIEDSKYGYSTICYYALQYDRVLVRADMRVFPDNVVRTLDYTFVWDGADLRFGDLLLVRQP